MEKVCIYYRKIDHERDSDKLTIAGLKKYLAANGREELLCDIHISRSDRNSKPFFKEYPEVYHNVSHSGGWWACAYAEIENGLDLQKTDDRNGNEKKIASRFLHPDEISWLSKQDTGQFYRLWAFNESYVKYTGAGLLKGLDYFSTIRSGGVITGDEIPGVEGICQKEVPFPEKGFWLVLTTRSEVEISLEYLQTES